MTLEVPQLLGAAECLPCEVCCRFPDRASPFRPVFRAAEIEALVAAGNSPATWAHSARDPAPPLAARVQVVPDRDGGGHHCPFLDEATHACTIFARRPLDCRLYPLMLVLGPGGDEVVLHLDAHCPFTARLAADPAYVAAIAARLEAEADTLARDGVLIGDPVQPLAVVARLPRLSRALGVSDGWRRLRRDDRPVVERANARLSTTAGDFARGFVPLYLHRNRHGMLLKEHGDHVLILALGDGVAWVPVAPLGPALDAGVIEALARALVERGAGSTLHLPALRVEDLPALIEAGFTVRLEGERVIARTGDVANPSGKKRRAWRNLIARAERDQTRVRPCAAADLAAVLAVWEAWFDVRVAPGGTAAQMMAHEARSGIVALVEDLDALGAIALVATQGERIVGFTAGAAIDERTFVVLFEFALPPTRGVAQLLARDLAVAARSWPWLDLMDSYGRVGVARAKARYGVTVPVFGALRRAAPPGGA